MSGLDWAHFFARRIVALGILLVAISFLVFSLLYLSPGNVLDMLLGPRPRSPATVQALTNEYHLNKPFLVQYGMWAREAASFHFGTSIQTSLPVSKELAARLPTSLFLGGYAYVLTMAAGIGLGVLAAFRRRSAIDRGAVASAVIGLSTPVFVAGVFLLYVFAIQARWFPAFGAGSGGLDEVLHLTLPAVALAITTSAYVLKHTRAAVASVLEQDYIAFARARGLSRSRILFSYVLRNALIPIVTISGVLLSTLIVGSVLVEITFSIEGVGQLLVQSANAKDIPMLQGVVLVVAVIIVLANLLADVMYLIADPRIRNAQR